MTESDYQQLVKQLFPLAVHYLHVWHRKSDSPDFPAIQLGKSWEDAWYNIHEPTYYNYNRIQELLDLVKPTQSELNFNG